MRFELSEACAAVGSPRVPLHSERERGGTPRSLRRKAARTMSGFARRADDDAVTCSKTCMEDPMELQNVGASGLRVSKIGLGCNNFGARVDDETARAVVYAALDAGITLFDTSDSYGGRGGSETLLGKVLGERRKDIALATKFASPMDDAGRLQGGSRGYVIQAAEASLKRLRTDWIDLYQFHKPDPLTPLEESLRALEDLVRAGKVRYVGLSNHPAWQVAEAAWIARASGFCPIVCCQDEYSLLKRSAEADLIPAMRHFGLGLLPYFPLASGLLTGKYKRGEPLPPGARLTLAGANSSRFIHDANWTKVEALRAFAETRGHALLDLAFSWLAAQPAVSSVIAGATKPAQIEANLKAATWALSSEDLKEIDRLTKT
jgi:aryl-alcohol dehydrogenase-like predicted oxidoreductase